MRLWLRGVYTSINTMSCLAHVFEQDNALAKLEAFASLNGPAWYGLAPNEETITLVKRDEPVAFPAKIETGAGPSPSLIRCSRSIGMLKTNVQAAGLSGSFFIDS